MSGVIKMEEGLYRLCAKQIKEDNGFREEFNIAAGDAVNAQVFEAFRLYKLKRTLQYVYSKSRFYRELFDRYSIKAEDVRSLRDLSLFPLTGPDELAARPYDFLCLSQAAVEKVITFTSSGTVGPQKRIFFTAGDLDRMTDFMGVGMNTITGPDGLVQILLPGGPVMGQADLLARGVRKMGAGSVYTGMFVSSGEQIKTIIENGSTVVFGETRLIYRITKETENQYDLPGLGVKTLFVTTSHLSGVMRRNLENAWNCRVCSHYGLTEMGLGLAVDCPCGEGYHINELDIIPELIDPENGETLPDGEEGELVFTTISREGMPLIRYRTRDIARMTSQPCACGSRMKTISHVSRRLESLVEISPGVDIYPVLFDDVLFKFPEVVDYDISIEKKDGRWSILFEVEVIRNNKELSRQITRQLQKMEVISRYFYAPVIKQVPSGSLRGGVHFKKMIKIIN